MTTNAKTIQWWGKLLAAITCKDWHSSVSWCLIWGHMIYSFCFTQKQSLSCIIQPLFQYLNFTPVGPPVTRAFFWNPVCLLGFTFYLSLPNHPPVTLCPSLRLATGIRLWKISCFSYNVELNFSTFCAHKIKIPEDQISLCAHSSFDHNDLNTWNSHQHQLGL